MELSERRDRKTTPGYSSFTEAESPDFIGVPRSLKSPKIGPIPTLRNFASYVKMVRVSVPEHRDPNRSPFPD